MAKSTYKIQGLDCAEEIAVLRAELAPLPGVQDLSFDVLHGRMTVDYAETEISSDSLIATVAKTGMRAEIWQEAGRSAEAGRSGDRWDRTITTFGSGLSCLAGFASYVAAEGWNAALGGNESVAMPLLAKSCYVIATALGAWHVIPKAARAARRLRPDMNLLMVIAMVGALAIHEFAEAATVAFLFSVSLTLEAWSVGHARKAIGALMSITPDTARVIDSDGGESVVEVSTVSIGSTLVVRPGERIPLDGNVLVGETTVDQAPITGESKPVPKSAGSEVFAGTINQDGAFTFSSTKPATDTTLARIIRLVGDAQSKRAPSEQWVEQFARYYTPGVMVFAIAIMTLPPLLSGGTWSHWFYEGLVLLVIACPCALVISTPVSIVAALAASAKRGLLIKGGRWMEAPAHLKAIALDKTGTLTEGRPKVQSVFPLSGHSEDEVLEIAAAVEMRSEHPLAKAIVEAAKCRGLRPIAAENYQAMKGKGATAKVHGKLIWIGSHRLLEERGQETPQMHQHLVQWEETGASVVVVGKDEHVCGFISLADRIRPEAKAAVDQMRQAGILYVAMLTGDNRGTANVIGEEAGVDKIHAELLPEDKVKIIDDLVGCFTQVAMLGDGVNDAPAMARASLGIAMGAIGTDVALETADIALMGDDLSAIPWLIHHARRTVAIIRQNIVAALAVKALFVVLTLAGHASLWAAIAADTGMSLLVIFNSLRLLRATRS